MARAKKSPLIDSNDVLIGDFCQSEGISEQIFRLELMQYQDDADSAKSVNFDVAKEVSSIIQATVTALPQNIETPETFTPSVLQSSRETATEQPQKPQNTSMTANGANTINPVSQPKAILFEELIKSADEAIELADLVQIYRNEQILNNAETRDSELVVKLRERRIETRNNLFDAIRELNQKQPTKPDFPEFPSNLKDEIAALSDELGKRLNRAA